VLDRQDKDYIVFHKMDDTITTDNHFPDFFPAKFRDNPSGIGKHGEPVHGREDALNEQGGRPR